MGKHIDEADLVLDAAPLTVKTMFVFILGHASDRGVHRELVKDLWKAGFPKEHVQPVCYGATIGDEDGKRILRASEICHFSVLHRVLPRIAQFISKRRSCGLRTTVIYLMEADCLLGDVSRSDMLAMAAMSSIVWGGYREQKHGGHYALNYGQYVNVEGSHALSFRGRGCVSLYRTLFGSPRYCHIDYLYSRGLHGVYVPCSPSFGCRTHKSAILPKLAGGRAGKSAQRLSSRIHMEVFSTEAAAQKGLHIQEKGKVAVAACLRPPQVRNNYCIASCGHSCDDSTN